MQKNAALLSENGEEDRESSISLSDPRTSIPWKLSSAFHRTGHAHRKGRFRESQLEVWVD